MDAYGATIVIHDKSRVAPPHMTFKSKAMYIRFHGPQGDYRGTYDEAFLHEYAAYIYEWLVEGKSVFVYFNNTMGKAFDNLKKLNEYVRFVSKEKEDIFMNRKCRRPWHEAMQLPQGILYNFAPTVYGLKQKHLPEPTWSARSCVTNCLNFFFFLRSSLLSYPFCLSSSHHSSFEPKIFSRNVFFSGFGVSTEAIFISLSIDGWIA